MPATVNTRATLHRGRVFDLVTENITLENGVTVDLDVIRHPGASAIVPVFDHDTLVLIRQYRHAVGDYIWEIPAGTFEGKETPIACAKRELAEETGFSAGKWQKLGEIIPVPGYSDERIHLFLATGLVPCEQHLDRDEMLNVHKIEFDRAVKMIHGGEIQDGKTVSGLLMAWRRLKRPRPG